MTDFRYFRDFALATNDDGTHVIKIDQNCFVVDGDTVQELGTNLHYDPVTDQSFQLLADGRRVSALADGHSAPTRRPWTTIRGG